MYKKPKSWKTTAGAVTTLIGAAIYVVCKVTGLDVPAYESTGGAVAAIGMVVTGWFARDDSKD